MHRKLFVIRKSESFAGDCILAMFSRSGDSFEYII